MEEKEEEIKGQKNSATAVLEKTEKDNKKIKKNEIKNDKKSEEKLQEIVREKEVKEEKKQTENKQEELKQDERQTQKAQEDSSKENKKIKIGIWVIVSIIIITIIGLLSTMFAIVNIGNSKMMKGISIGGIDVSGMTKEETEKQLKEMYSARGQKEIYLTYGKFEGTITYETLEVQYQVEKAIKEAYEIGRKGNIFLDNIEILKTLIENKNIEVESIIDNETIKQISENINNNIEGAVQQPSYYIEDGNLIITSGKKGVKVNESQLLEQIYQIIRQNSENQQKITIPVIEVEPDKIDIDKIHSEVYKEVKNAYYTKEPFTIYPEEDGINFDVENAKAMIAETKDEYQIPLIITKPTITVNQIGTEAFPDLLARFSTKYNAGNKGRTTNLKLASNKINGTVLLPGQEFSYNKVVGERTIAAGYKEAATYSNGEVVDGLGGGICQISSTLYDAVVMANLKVTTRRNHQFVTSYVGAGKDATVVWGSQDFKFVNTRKYPVKLELTVSGGVATVSVWGIKEDVEYDITIETRKIATIPFTTQYIQDPTLPAGKEVVKQAGSNGRKVEAYKVMRLNGQVVSRTLLSKDTYNAMKKIVRVGTGGQ